MLVFNTTVVYADIHGGSSGSLDDPTKLYPSLFDENGNFKPPAGQELFNRLILGDKTGSALAPILSTLSSFLDGYDNSNGQGISVETNSGGSTVHFHGSFIDELNAALQDKVHALNGYWLLEPAHSKSEFNAQAKFDSILSNAHINNAYISDILKSEDFKNSFFQYVNDAYVIFDGLASTYSDGSEPDYSTYAYVLGGDYIGMGDCNGYIVADSYPNKGMTFYIFSDNKLVSKGTGYLNINYICLFDYLFISP